jgi:hypothetical protein
MALALYDDDVHNLRMALKRKKLAAVQKAFPVAGLPEDGASLSELRLRPCGIFNLTIRRQRND